MTDSREDILGRVRARLERAARGEAEGMARIEAHLAARAQGPRPPLGPDLAGAFAARSEKLSSTVMRVATLAEVPAEAVRYLRAGGLPLAAVCAPELAALDWAAAGLAIEARAARGDDLVGITGCYAAIAETGTLMLCSAPHAPATVSLLPETHIAVLEAQRIVPGMEEAWQLARSELGALPRAVNFVSGPSRTGDIEQTIVLGAHGPYRVHVIVVGQ